MKISTCFLLILSSVLATGPTQDTLACDPAGRMSDQFRKGRVLIITSTDFLKASFLEQRNVDLLNGLLFFKLVFEAFIRDRGLRPGDPVGDVWAGLPAGINVKYYCSETLPPFFIKKTEVIGLLKKLQSLSGDSVTYKVINPEEAVEKYSQEQLAEYETAKEKGETPKEPREVPSIKDLFSGKSPKTDSEIADERTKKSQSLSRQNQTSVDQEYRNRSVNPMVPEAASVAFPM